MACYQFTPLQLIMIISGSLLVYSLVALYFYVLIMAMMKHQQLIDVEKYLWMFTSLLFNAPEAAI